MTGAVPGGDGDGDGTDVGAGATVAACRAGAAAAARGFAGVAEVRRLGPVLGPCGARSQVPRPHDSGRCRGLADGALRPVVQNVQNEKRLNAASAAVRVPLDRRRHPHATLFRLALVDFHHLEPLERLEVVVVHDAGSSVLFVRGVVQRCPRAEARRRTAAGCRRRTQLLVVEGGRLLG